MKKYRFALIFLFTTIIVFIPIYYGFAADGSSFGGGPGSGNSQVAFNGTESDNFIVAGIKRIFADILFIPLGLTSLLLGISGTLLNAVLNFSVINLTPNISAITGIPIAWGFLRDISNMVFIFVLIYIAIKTILGLGNNKMKQTLVAVVIAALLINFSLFFTKVMIDASNLLALTFYEKAVPNAGSGNLLTTGLANSFMQPLGLTSFYDVTQGSSLLTSLGSLGKVAAVSLFGSLFFIVLAFVFLAVSVMFLVRYVNIIFLLILSPVAFLGSVLPGIGERMRGWWVKSLSGNLVFAPVYMILTFAVLSVISSSGFISTIAATGGGATSAGSAGRVASSFSAIVGDPNSASQSTFGLVMNFIVVIVLAIGTLIISKTVADQGGSIGSKVVGGALGTSAGIAGFGGRKIVGGISRKTADSKNLREIAANEDGKYGRLNQMRAQAQLKLAQKGAGASFDIRGSKALDKVGGAIGFDATKEFGLGKAEGKGGYDAIVEKNAKRKADFAKSLGPTQIEIEEAKRELEEAKKSGDPVKIKEVQERFDNLMGLTKERVGKLRGEQNEDKNKQIENEKQARDERVNRDSSVKEEKSLEEEIARDEEEIENIPTSEEKDIRKEELNLKKEKLEKVKKVTEVVRALADDGFEKRKKEIEKEAEEKIKEIDKTFKEGGAGKRRAVAYANRITHPGSMNIFGYNIPLPSSSRAGFIGPVSYSNKMAAIKIKEEKKTKDSFLEMAKKLAKEEEGEGGADESEKPKDDKNENVADPNNAQTSKT